MASRPVQRLLLLLRRELGATRTGVAGPDEEVPDAPSVVVLALPRGLVLWALLKEPPADREAVRARMQILADSFSQLLELEAQRKSLRKPDPARALRHALKQLAQASAAHDVLVLDTRSPMLWGSASGLSGPVLGPPELHVVGDDPPSGPEDKRRVRRLGLLRRVVTDVRRLPEVERLPRGAHLRRSTRVGEEGYLIRSFASIYLLVLVFDGPFEELRAEREAARALSTIESLVLAIPPPDPDDGTASSAMAKRR